jgi:hypothetical protein
MGELEAEFEACLDPFDEHEQVAHLLRLGISTRVIYGPRSLVGVGRIISNSSGFFEFHEDGTEALIVAEGEPDIPGWHWIDDLVAFMPDRPERWWLRRGQVDLLGGYNLRPHKLDDTRLHTDPLDWLRGGATGICVVDWNLDPDRLLYGAGKIVADSQDLRRRLRKRIVENALARHDVGVRDAA